MIYYRSYITGKCFIPIKTSNQGFEPSSAGVPPPMIPVSKWVALVRNTRASTCKSPGGHWWQGVTFPMYRYLLENCPATQPQKQYLLGRCYTPLHQGSLHDTNFKKTMHSFQRKSFNFYHVFVASSLIPTKIFKNHRKNWVASRLSCWNCSFWGAHTPHQHYHHLGNKAALSGNNDG